VNRRAAGGVVGPAVIVSAWALLGLRARADGYSAVADPISRLAASGAPTQPLMTAGLVAYSAAVSTYVGEVRDAFGRPAAMALAVNAVATAAVAATPLDSPLGGGPHAMAAGLTYASLAAVPLLAARPLGRLGHHGAATASRAVGVAAAACLALSAAGTGATGLFQRTGLTLGHAWLAVGAVRLARRGSIG
jgi:hypothetical protein